MVRDAARLCHSDRLSGFTATTGTASGEEHEVLNWTYESLAVPTPANYALFGAGLTSAVAGENTTFGVQLCDQWRNNYTVDSGVQLQLSLASPPGWFLCVYSVCVFCWLFLAFF